MTAPEPLGSRRLGFLDGVSAFFGGAWFVIRQPSLWGWAAVPIAVVAILGTALGGVLVWQVGVLAQSWLGASSGSAWATAGVVLLRVVLSIIALIVSFLVALTFAQPISGFALDRIARRQELALGGREWPEQRLVPSAWRSLLVAGSALLLTLPVLGLLSLVTLAFPPASVVTIPLKFLVTGFAVAYDFLDYPFSLRGAGIGARLAFVRRNFTAILGFGAAGALVLLIPGAGLLVLPFGVAGAARMVATAGGDRA